MNYLLSTKIKLEPLIDNCLNSIENEMFLLYLFSLKRIPPEFALDMTLLSWNVSFCGGLGSYTCLGASLFLLLLFFTKSRSCCMSYFLFLLF